MIKWWVCPDSKVVLNCLGTKIMEFGEEGGQGIAWWWGGAVATYNVAGGRIWAQEVGVGHWEPLGGGFLSPPTQHPCVGFLRCGP